MIWIYDDPEALSQAAAGMFVQQARRAIENSGSFCVALSGGTTPRRTYELLAQPPHRERIHWSRVNVFWGDERCLPSGDPRRNEEMARQALLDHVQIPKAQVHPIPCSHDPFQAAQQYERVLKEFFKGWEPRLDLVLLGLGENGHTASLFPGTPALSETRYWTADVYVPEQDLHRVTLTAPFINQAAVIMFLVQGASKAWVVREVLEGQQEPERLPAQLIKPVNGEIHWLLDKEASSLLSQRA